LTTYNATTLLKLAYKRHICMFILQFSDKPFMIKVLGKEMWVKKEGEGKGNRLLILKLCNTAVPTNKSEEK
jgi:hypothetical protein